MKRYVVKSIYTATAQNKLFAGEQEIELTGKGERTIYSNSACSPQPLIPYFVSEYGYKRACDARRSYLYRHPQNDTNWRTTTEIIAIIIDDESGRITEQSLQTYNELQDFTKNE